MIFCSYGFDDCIMQMTTQLTQVCHLRSAYILGITGYTSKISGVFGTTSRWSGWEAIAEKWSY